MNDRDMLLIMSICELLDKPVNPNLVLVTYRIAQEKLRATRQSIDESNSDDRG